MSEIKSDRMQTKVVHAGEPEPRISGAVVTPVFQSSTYLFEGRSEYDDVKYVRLNNSPNHDVLHAKLAALENAEAALVTGSGMAAISAALLTCLRQGDHVLVQDCLYGGTHGFVYNSLPSWGIAVDAYDPTAPGSWESKLRPQTKVIYAEAITNPLIQVGELDAIAAFAREHGLVSMIDNTFASPVNFRPAEHGFNLSLHSATKYLNGHTDIAAGAVIGDRELVEQVRHMLNHLGGVLDPHACFLLQRGIKTLALRVGVQNANALRLAEFLHDHARVDAVHYPGLPSSRDHARAQRLLDGFGGMLSFEVSGGVEAAQSLMETVTIPLIAPSLGGVETLITRPATTSHVGMSEQERGAVGVTDSMIRLSVGIEAADDLVEDFAAALAS